MLLLDSNYVCVCVRIRMSILQYPTRYGKTCMTLTRPLDCSVCMCQVVMLLLRNAEHVSTVRSIMLSLETEAFHLTRTTCV